MLKRKALAVLAAATVSLTCFPIAASATSVYAAYETYQEALKEEHSMTITWIKYPNNPVGLQDQTDTVGWYCTDDEVNRYYNPSGLTNEMPWSDVFGASEISAANSKLNADRQECEQLKQDVITAVRNEQWSTELEGDVGSITEEDLYSSAEAALEAVRKNYLSELKREVVLGEPIPDSVYNQLRELSSYYSPARDFFNEAQRRSGEAAKSRVDSVTAWSREQDAALGQMGTSGGADAKLEALRSGVVQAATAGGWTREVEDPAKSDLAYLALTVGYQPAIDGLNRLRDTMLTQDFGEAVRWSINLEDPQTSDLAFLAMNKKYAPAVELLNKKRDLALSTNFSKFTQWTPQMEDPTSSTLKILAERSYAPAVELLTTIRENYLSNSGVLDAFEWTPAVDQQLAAIAPWSPEAQAKLTELREEIFDWARFEGEWSKEIDDALSAMVDFTANGERQLNPQARGMRGNLRDQLYADWVWKADEWSPQMERALGELAKIQENDLLVGNPLYGGTRDVADLLNGAREVYVASVSFNEWTPQMEANLGMMEDAGYTPAATKLAEVRALEAQKEGVTPTSMPQPEPPTSGTGAGSGTSGTGEPSTPSEPTPREDSENTPGGGDTIVIDTVNEPEPVPNFADWSNDELFKVAEDMLYGDGHTPVERDAFANELAMRTHNKYFDPAILGVLDMQAGHGDTVAERQATYQRLSLAATILGILGALVAGVYNVAHSQGML